MAFLREAGNQVPPQLFGYEGQEGMHQPQGALQDMSQDRQRRWSGAGAKPDFGHLNVPVAEVIPEEVVELLLSLSQLKALQGLVHFHR